MFGIGAPEMIVVGIIALLLFGKRLPEVARSMGKGVTEFKRGLAGIEEETTRNNYREPERETSRPRAADDRAEVTAPKFEPPVSAPSDRT